MKRHLVTATLALGCLLPVQSVAFPHGAHAAVQSCPASFVGNVTSGPDAGYALQGQLSATKTPSGELHGALIRADGSRVPFTGQTAGSTITLTFHLGHGDVVNGSRASTADFTSCTGTSSGSLRGPRDGDTGDWGIIWGD